MLFPYESPSGPMAQLLVALGIEALPILLDALKYKEPCKRVIHMVEEIGLQTILALAVEGQAVKKDI